MQIKEVYIENFGRFSEKNVSFQKGINLIYGSNESGKSTLHTFIKSMLYGIERGRGLGAKKDTFRRYEPWKNSVLFGGRLLFESGEKRFWLERFFGKAHKKERLFCVEDGEELSLLHGDLEMLLGGMNQAKFENTISIGQLNIEPNLTLQESLREYAANLGQGEEEGISVKKGLERLKQRRKEVEKKVVSQKEKKQSKKEKLLYQQEYIRRDMERLETQINEEGVTQEPPQEGNPGWMGYLFGVLGVLLIWKLPDWYKLLGFLCFLPMGISFLQKKEGKADSMEWKKKRLLEEKKEKEVLLENLAEELQEMEETGEEEKRWRKQREAILLAEDTLQKLGKQMGEGIRRKMSEKVTQILSSITGNERIQVVFSEEKGIYLLIEGQLIFLEQMSRGTIEQIYFSLRMASAELLCQEESPYLLDDTFIYYDEKRLEQVLEWLWKTEKQILLFTCHRREEEVFKKLKIPYHKISLS